MFEFFRRKNAQETQPEGEQKALPEASEEAGVADSEEDQVLKDAVEAMLVEQARPDPAPAPKPGPPLNVVGPDTKIGGSLSTHSGVLVLGEIEGNVGAVSVTVDDDGVIRGDVTTKEDATVRGMIFGNMIVDGKLTITATGSVTGGVKARAIAIEEGGELRGRCSMTGGASNLSVVSAS